MKLRPALRTFLPALLFTCSPLGAASLLAAPLPAAPLPAAPLLAASLLGAPPPGAPPPGAPPPGADDKPAPSPALPPAVLEGQVVCAECWHEADRATTPYGTPADMACALRCEKKGIPQALAVAEGGDWVLYVLSARGPGSPDASDWFPLVGARARVTGAITGTGEKRAIAVESIEPLNVASASRSGPDSAPETGPPELRADGGLSLVDLSGHPQSLSALRGRVVVLNFWASWCVPCRQEMPDLVRLQTEMGAEGVAVVGASADAAEGEPVVRKFLAKTPVNFPVWLGATTGDMARFGVGPDLPATVVLDRNGRVVERFHGRITREAVAAAVRLALDSDPAPAAGAATGRGESAPRIAGASPRVSSVPS